MNINTCCIKQEPSSEAPNATDDEQQNIRKKDEKLKGVADGSTSEMVEIHQGPTQTRDGSSSSRSFTSDVEHHVTEQRKIREDDEHPKEVAVGGGSEASSSASLPRATQSADEATSEVRENETSSRSLNDAEGAVNIESSNHQINNSNSEKVCVQSSLIIPTLQDYIIFQAFNKLRHDFFHIRRRLFKNPHTMTAHTQAVTKRTRAGKKLDSTTTKLSSRSSSLLQCRS